MPLSKKQKKITTTNTLWHDCKKTQKKKKKSNNKKVSLLFIWQKMSDNWWGGILHGNGKSSHKPANRSFTRQSLTLRVNTEISFCAPGLQWTSGMYYLLPGVLNLRYWYQIFSVRTDQYQNLCRKYLRLSPRGEATLNPVPHSRGKTAVRTESLGHRGSHIDRDTLQSF